MKLLALFIFLSIFGKVQASSPCDDTFAQGVPACARELQSITPSSYGSSSFVTSRRELKAKIVKIMEEAVENYPTLVRTSFPRNFAEIITNAESIIVIEALNDLPYLSLYVAARRGGRSFSRLFKVMDGLPGDYLIRNVDLRDKSVSELYLGFAPHELVQKMTL